MCISLEVRRGGEVGVGMGRGDGCWGWRGGGMEGEGKVYGGSRVGGLRGLVGK